MSPRGSRYELKLRGAQGLWRTRRKPFPRAAVVVICGLSAQQVDNLSFAIRMSATLDRMPSRSVNLGPPVILDER